MVKKTTRLLATILIFLGGISIGYLATTAWPNPRAWLGSDDPIDTVVLKKLQRELHLTGKQTTQIAPIITRACTDLRLLAEEGRARRLDLLDEIGTDISPLLSDDQQQRLDTLQSEWQAQPPAKREMRIVALY
jgi:hypothetical protein